ncbi:MAG: alpha-galactosidase [Bacteroidota bacterium]|nr:alpha-galactosidase [Bacteroidota bacterium]
MKLLINFFIWGQLFLQSYIHCQPSKSIEMDNGLLKISFNKITKTWSLFELESNLWKPVIFNATMSLSFQNGDSLVLSGESGEIISKIESYSDAIGKGKKIFITLSNSKMQLKLDIVLYNQKKNVTISASIKNLMSDDWKPKAFHLIDIHGGGYLAFKTNNILMQINGYQSWSNCEIAQLDSISKQTSYWSTIFYETAAHSSILFGFLTNNQAINSISTEPLIKEAGQIQLSTVSDIKTLKIISGTMLQTDRLMISLDSDPFNNLERYSEYLQMFAPSINKPFTPAGKPILRSRTTETVPTGWCSWYYYYQHISEDSILTNLNFASKHLKDAGLQYIQIDDGFQISAGDWGTNKKFPHGHKWLTDQIHNKGFLAGLWVAPFAISENSSIYKKHRDWLLTGEGDSLKEFFTNDWWGGRIFSLDPTHPEVQKWLTNLFKKIVNEWGYDYVKIDFLYFACEGKTYYQPASSAQAYQLGLQAIRSGVGSDKFILGCGAPIGISIGYVDGMRIGPDISPTWGGITPGVNAAAQRSFYHNKLWFNDSDCLVVREPLTLGQARVWAAIVALSGQMNILSDKLFDLPAERVDLLKMTLPSYSQPAVPIDLFTQPKEMGLTIYTDDKKQSFKLSDRWKFAVGDSMEWKEPNFDDNDWKEIVIPSRWENVGYPNLDGFAWYRTKFTLPTDWTLQSLKLYLGKIDDCDQTYFNGNLIGKTGDFPPNYVTEWTSFRIYQIPEQVVNWKGDNTISIRVYDGGGAGGFYNVKQYNLPSIWNLPVEKNFGKWNVVGLFNWTNDETSIVLNAADLKLSPKKTYLICERWSEPYIGEMNNEIKINLSPTSSKILSIHEKRNQPIIISSSRHIVQGGVDLADIEWDSKKNILSAESENILDGSYSVTIYIPEGMQIKNVATPARYEIKKVTDRISIIKFDRAKTKFPWKVVF